MLLGGVTSGGTITFTIDGTEYEAESGMTWTEWCESDYNTGGLYISGDEVCCGASSVLWDENETDVISPTAVIVSGAYVLSLPASIF